MTDPIGEHVALDAADSRGAAGSRGTAHSGGAVHSRGAADSRGTADARATAAPLGPLGVLDAVDPIESWPIGRLLSTAARLVEHAWQEALEQRDLTHAGLITLHLLDGGALDQTELAHRARVEAQTMSRTVDRLERSGFVARTSDPLDRRRRHIVRTESGDRALEATRALEAEVFPAVGDPELVRYSLLEIIHAASRDRWGSA